jgi:hypothetical protein
MLLKWERRIVMPRVRLSCADADFVKTVWLRFSLSRVFIRQILEAKLMPILRFFCAICCVAAASIAQASQAPLPPGAIPENPSQYRAVQSQHARIVRRAERMCAVDYGWKGGAGFRMCMVSSVDNAVMLSGNSALQAYHRSLPFPARYRWR